MRRRDCCPRFARAAADLVLRELPDELVDGLLTRYLPDLGADERATLVGLAEGSPGRAVSLAARGGVGLYRDLLGVLATAELPGLDSARRPRAWRPGQRAGRARRVPDRCRAHYLVACAARSSRRYGGRAGGGSSPERPALNGRLLDRGELEQWVEVWEKLRRLFAQAEAVNLDPKQVLLNAFTTIQHAAKA